MKHKTELSISAIKTIKSRRPTAASNSQMLFERCAHQSCGTTLVEVVISTVILSLISQILLYGFQIANTQTSSTLSKRHHITEDANNCMEYLLRQLNSNNQTSKITSTELASCQSRCQQLSDNASQITITTSKNSVHLLPNHRLQGYWITVTATDQSASTTPSENSVANLNTNNNSRSYSVSTLASYHDSSSAGNATTNASAGFHGKRTMNLGADRREMCANLKRYEHQQYIPLPSTLFFQLHSQCMNSRTPSAMLDNSRITFPISSAEGKRVKWEGLKYRGQQYVNTIVGIWHGVFDSALAQPHCFLDGICVNSSKEAKKLQKQALRQLKSLSFGEKLKRAIKRY